jgi:hypothetical protein
VSTVFLFVEKEKRRCFDCTFFTIEEGLEFDLKQKVERKLHIGV